MTCETCEHFHAGNDKIKHPRYWLCSMFPRDEVNHVSDKLRLSEPFHYCRDINSFGQCKYYEKTKGEENE